MYLLGCLIPLQLDSFESFVLIVCSELLLVCVSSEIWANLHVGSVPRKACMCRSWVVGFQRVQTKLVEANQTLKVSYSFWKHLESLHVLLLLNGEKIMNIVSLYTNHDELFCNWDEHNVARDLISGIWNRCMKLDGWVFHPHSYKNITFYVFHFRQYNRISHQTINRNSISHSSNYHATGLRCL